MWHLEKQAILACFSGWFVSPGQIAKCEQGCVSWETSLAFWRSSYTSLRKVKINLKREGGCWSILPWPKGIDFYFSFLLGVIWNP